MKITDLKTEIIKDSRGNPTIEIHLFSDDFQAKASAGTGKSRGKFEASVLPIKDAILFIEKIKPALLQIEFQDIEDFEKRIFEFSDFENNKKLGNNAILVLGIAFIRLLAKKNKTPLYQLIGLMSQTEKPAFPYFFVNLINGGLHARKEDSPLAFQEYLIIPQERSPKLALKTVFDFIEILKGAALNQQGRLIEGDEGGFVISGDEPEIGLSVLKETLGVFQNRKKTEIWFGLDVAASSLFKKGNYCWQNKTWTNNDLMEKYEKIANSYNLFYLEDPFNEESWDDWQKLNQKIGSRVLVAGDDLTVTNPERMKKAKEKEAINSLIIKPSQIGSIGVTIEAIKLAKKFGWKIIVSHRSGETDDDFIADLSYGIAAFGLKAGSPLQLERLVKYERLIDIEKDLQKN